MLSTILNDDFVWTALVGSLHGRQRHSSTNFINVNCPMCHLRGHSRDTKMRLGLKRNSDGVGVFCFQCGIASRYQIGSLISRDMQAILVELGMPSMDVKRLNHKALQYRRLLTLSPEAAAILPMFQKPSFPSTTLPEGAKSITKLAEEGCEHPDFLAAVDYLFSRGEAVANSAEFYWSPKTSEQMNRRIILPFYYEGKIVGWTARLIDKATDKAPKYWSSVPTNFLFNSSILLDHERQFILLTEGVLDAAAIDGISPLGAKLTDEQILWLNSSGKKIIVIPDRDSAGERLIDVAMKNNWMVAFPTLKSGHGVDNWWSADVKDIAAATKIYGRLYTLRSIIETATNSKPMIAVKRQLLY